LPLSFSILLTFSPRNLYEFFIHFQNTSLVTFCIPFISHV
jgi:hypothetical protein